MKETLVVLTTTYVVYLIGSVIDSVLTSSVVDRGSNPDLVQLKTIKLRFVVFPLSTHLQGVRTKTNRVGIRIM